MKGYYLLGLSLIVFISVIGCQKTVEKNPIAVIETNKGIIKVELFQDQVPNTTANFIKLAESKFYDDTKFHRVIESFMIKGGDPISRDNNNKDLWGSGGPNYKIKDEFVKGLSNLRGTLSMANRGPDTGASQFFINVVDNSYLDFDKPPYRNAHAVFGKVIEGMHVVDAIASVKTDQFDRPIESVIVKKVTIVRPS